MRRGRVSWRPMGYATVALLLCAGGATAADAPSTRLRVFAAASLVDAFGEIARSFERAHPGTEVQLNLAGSQQLAAQIEHGAAADVFASADERWMSHLRERGLIAGEPVVFAHNRLAVILPRTNPARLRRLQDIGRRGVKVVIGAEAVPVGLYSRQALRRLSRLESFAPDFATRVLANVVSQEENVKSVIAKVQLGEADVGMVYRSDVTPSVSRYLRMIEIPEAANVIADYPIAVVANSRVADTARDFIALVLSDDGQRVLQRRGLMPTGGAP